MVKEVISDSAVGPDFGRFVVLQHILGALCSETISKHIWLD